MNWTKLHCSSDDLYLPIEIDGETKTYIVNFYFECEQGVEGGAYFESPDFASINHELTINEVHLFREREEELEIDFERQPAEWQKQFRAAVENYALENLEE